MYDVLYKHLTANMPLTAADFEVFKSVFRPRRLHKKEFLLHAGEAGTYTAIVETGALRSYTVDAKGTERIVQFALEGWWMADLYSFLTNEPSTYYIEALEDSAILLIDQAGFDSLFEQVPAFERYYRRLLQNNYIATHRRLMSNLSQTAEGKYEALLAAYPAISQRVPQHMIASYLGITPEFLSRIRGRK